MKTSKKLSDEIKLQEMENLLFQLESDLKYLKTVQKKLSTIEKDKKSLQSYYQTAYLEDYKESKGLGKHYRILDQDSIWNVLQDLYNEKLRIIKKLMSTIELP